MDKTDKDKVEHCDLLHSRHLLAEKMKRITVDIKRVTDGVTTFMGGNHIRAGSAALNLTNVLGKFADAYTKFETERSMTDIKSAINSLQLSIDSMFSAEENIGSMLFDDAFKGLWNAGKMIGWGLTTQEALKERILYRGKDTVLSEVLGNVNFSEHSIGRANYKQTDETDFSNMNINEIADALTDIMANKALPKHCEIFKDDLASFILDNAKYVGHLEKVIRTRQQHKTKMTAINLA